VERSRYPRLQRTCQTVTAGYPCPVRSVRPRNPLPSGMGSGQLSLLLTCALWS